jgi:hypothetical protein
MARGSLIEQGCRLEKSFDTFLCFHLKAFELWISASLIDNHFDTQPHPWAVLKLFQDCKKGRPDFFLQHISTYF